MQVTVEKNELVVRIPLESPRPSKTGKTNIVASTGGFTKTAAAVGGKAISLNLTAIIPKG